MGKREDVMYLILNNDTDDNEEINSISEGDVIAFNAQKRFPIVKGDDVYQLSDVINDTKCISVWTIPKTTPKEVVKWLEQLFDYIGESVRIVKCRVIFESIEWKLLEWVEQ